MSATAREYMVSSMQAYFAKVKALIATGGSASFRFKTGSVPAAGQVIYDAPTELGYDPAAYEVYSTGIQLTMVDPTVTNNPPVVDATTVLSYTIQPDGKIVIKSNFESAAVTYYVRVTMPVKK